MIDTRPLTPFRTKARLIYLGLDGNWVSRMVTVPTRPGEKPVGCWQAVQDTRTMDCFFHGIDPDTQDVIELRHLALDPGDVMR